MFYNGSYDYQDIYNLNVGQNPSLSFSYYDVFDTHKNFPLNLTTTMTYSNLDTSTPGYYYRTYQATDNQYYNLTFRIVFKVGNPVNQDRVPQEHIYYNYSTTWEDQLLSYGEWDYSGQTPTYQGLQSYTYDNQGNPTEITNFYFDGVTYDHASLSWSGRELTKISIYNSSQVIIYKIQYTYNDQGYRINQTISYLNGSTWGDIKVVDYELIDDRVVYERGTEYNLSFQEINNYAIIFTYDYDGTLISFNYEDDTHTSAEYFYLRNQQGDITHIINANGTTIVKYTYDAYGNIIDENVEPGYQHIFDHNSYTYRGYRFDSDINLYYLNSRYYNPEVGRFINADGLLGETGNIQSTNMFSYCANNPVMYSDISGYAPEWVEDLIAGVVVTVIVVALVVAAVSTGGAAGIVMMSVAGGMGYGALNEASIAIENGTSIAAGIYGGALKGGTQGLAVGLGVITGAGLVSSGWGIIALGSSLAVNYGAGYGKYGIDCYYNGYDFNPDYAYTMGMKQMVSSAFAFGTGFLLGASGFYSIPGQKLGIENQIGYKAAEYLFKGIYYLPIDYVIQMM